jgi:branched-chain amino acid transport system substrate-binding protein
MKKLLLASAATALVAGPALAQEDIKIGIILGFTGPLESITVRGDSTCTDAPAATAAAERLITAEGVKGIIGGDCSGMTGAVLQNVARPNGIVMISPSATSPALTTAEDDGLFFRTAPSDAREGEVMADILTEKGIKSIALTYTNNDYGKGLAEAIATGFIAKGGTVTINASHEDGKADYSAEVAALASAGGDLLVVAGYLDQGGKGIIQASLDSGASRPSACRAAWWATTCRIAIGPRLDGSYGQVAQSDSPGAAT